MARPTAPLHVLVIDEVAALLNFDDAGTPRHVERLLSFILTRGSMHGVVVIGCAQDPGPCLAGIRRYFTVTIVMRLRSAVDTKMLLSHREARVARAHKIPVSAPGVGWVLTSDGVIEHVRADHWTDKSIGALARQNGGPMPVRRVQAPRAEP